MLTIDRLVLRLPAELSGRAGALGRAVAQALAQRRVPHAPERARLAVSVGDISPAMSDTAIAAALARAVRLDGGSGGGNGDAP
jgi:hypothetical protein